MKISSVAPAPLLLIRFPATTALGSAGGNPLPHRYCASLGHRSKGPCSLLPQCAHSKKGEFKAESIDDGEIAEEGRRWARKDKAI